MTIKKSKKQKKLPKTFESIIKKLIHFLKMDNKSGFRQIKKNIKNIDFKKIEELYKYSKKNKRKNKSIVLKGGSSNRSRRRSSSRSSIGSSSSSGSSNSSSNRSSNNEMSLVNALFYLIRISCVPTVIISLFFSSRGIRVLTLSLKQDNYILYNTTKIREELQILENSPAIDIDIFRNCMMVLYVIILLIGVDERYGQDIRLTINRFRNTVWVNFIALCQITILILETLQRINIIIHGHLNSLFENVITLLRNITTHQQIHTPINTNTNNINRDSNNNS